MKQFIAIFNKVGGKNILKQYVYGHVLIYSFLVTAILGFSKKSLEVVRLAVNNRIVNKLRNRYKKFIAEYKKNDSKQLQLPRTRSDRVWVCWFQGIDTAPDIVKKCYKSLKDNLKNKEIILITEDNCKDWVTFPDYIQEKLDKGIITKTHMSDFLRAELLINYGGTWIDATVFCSGSNYPDYILNSDFFIYQCMKPGLDGHATRTSSWFITSCTNHPIMMLARALMYEYWKTHNNMVDYFLIHDMIELAIEAYPDEWAKVIPFSNGIPHILLLRLFEKYDENIWKAAKEMTCFHKLTYKFTDKQKIEMKNKGTYYDVLFR